MHFRNKKEDVISFIENNIYQNHKIWIDIFQGGVCEQEDIEKDDENSNDGKSQENDNVNPEIWKNVQFDKKKMEIINKNGDITKYGQSIIENMNMYDIILIINKLQELIRASPQTAINMLNENKKIYYSFVHALFLLGILNIDANKLNDEELTLSKFYKIKNRLQYLFLNKKENNGINNTFEENMISESKINENSNIQNKLDNWNEENCPNSLYNIIKKKRNDNYKEQNEYGLYLNDKKKIKNKTNELNNNQEYENYYYEIDSNKNNEGNELIPNSYGNVLYSFISSASNKTNINEYKDYNYIENKIQYNKNDTNKSGLYGKGLYSSSNKNKKVKNNLNIDQTYYNNIENNEKENKTNGYDEDASNINSNQNHSQVKGFDFGKNLIKRINISNNQRRGIKLINRTNSGDNIEENVIKIKNVYNIQEEINKKDKPKKKKFENKVNTSLKKVLEKINLTINAIPEAEEQLVKEVINQKDILQNILASKYSDMLKWNNEQALRVLSLRKSLKKKGYTITGPI